MHKTLRLLYIHLYIFHFQWAYARIIHFYLFVVFKLYDQSVLITPCHISKKLG